MSGKLTGLLQGVRGQERTPNQSAQTASPASLLCPRPRCLILLNLLSLVHLILQGPSIEELFMWYENIHSNDDIYSSDQNGPVHMLLPLMETVPIVLLKSH